MDAEAYRNAAEIREEYGMFPDAVFRKGRMEVLDKLLRTAQKRGFFFYKLDPIFEDNAQRNLTSELSALEE